MTIELTAAEVGKICGCLNAIAATDLSDNPTELLMLAGKIQRAFLESDLPELKPITVQPVKLTAKEFTA